MRLPRPDPGTKRSSASPTRLERSASTAGPYRTWGADRHDTSLPHLAQEKPGGNRSGQPPSWAAMTRLTSYLDRGRRAYLDSVDMLREYRTRKGALTAPPLSRDGADRLFVSGRHDLASGVYRGALRA